jgi:hypothetical protein
MRNLYFHVGLPKTGTTSLQEILKANHSLFNDFGIGGMLENGEWSHHELAAFLNKLGPNITQKKGKQANRKKIKKGEAVPTKIISDLKTPGYINGIEEHSSSFPSFDNFNKLLITSEAFSGIGDAGADKVIKFAKEFDSRLTIVGTIRYLDEWLWSMWSQYTKSHWVDWCDYIDSLEFNKIGFLSTTFTPWVKSDVASIKILGYTKQNLISNFFKNIGLTQDQIDKIPQPKKSILNQGLDPITIMYQAAICKLVNHNIYENIRLNFYKPNKGAVTKLLLDITEISNPAFEISSIFEKKILSDEIILGLDYVPHLKKYVSSWMKDAQEFLNLSDQHINDESKKIIILAINNCANILENQIYKPLPNKNFLSILPVNSQFIGQARVIASSIVIASREVNNLPNRKFS